MPRKLKTLALSAAGLLVLTSAAFAQVSSIEGDVKGDDGSPLKGALVKIDRKDIKGHYQVKSDKKGHYFHTGLPLGTYRLTLEVDGKDVDNVDNVRTKLGDSTVIDFNLQQVKQRQQALSQAAQSGTLTKEQEREMSPEQKAALEKAAKERSAAMAKNKALNDAFNEGMQAMNGKQWDAAVAAFTKAGEIDPKQNVIWAQLAEAYMQSSQQKVGADQQGAIAKGLDAYTKAIELKPEDAALHNNYALALVRAKKIPEAQAELAKAAQLDPPNAGRYFYNLGAVLVNTGQNDAAGEAFKKAIASDPNYADAQYQYGMYLLGKAQVTPEGKVIPAEGTKEALEKYLQLKPNGSFAESAKGALATLDSSISTKYENPAAAKKGKKK
ncbi:MAG TPA: carboxypeptidase regulatory-like domain-containing protein [Bryobacteraceae bacterium]|nr:carboxypeptidase regulatory-like domain-containing protein [Bryobacteraceae bacterium]